MRRARLATAMACMCVAASGCGAEEAAKDTAKGVKEAVDPVAQAAQKTAAKGGARIDGGLTMRMPGLTIPMTLDGAVSFEDEQLRLTMDVGRLTGPLASKAGSGFRTDLGFPIELVQTPDEVFVSTEKLRERSGQTGAEWIKVDLSEVDEQAGLDLQRANQFSEVNPEALLRFLRTTADARKTGTADVRGVATDRYEGTIDLRRYPELVPEQDRAAAERTAKLMIEQWGGVKHRIQAFIDENGIILRQRLPMRFKEQGVTVKAVMVIDLLDVGRQHAIEVPDEHVVDVTDEAADQFGK